MTIAYFSTLEPRWFQYPVMADTPCQDTCIDPCQGCMLQQQKQTGQHGPMHHWRAGFDAGYLLHHEARLRTRIAAIEQEAARLVGSNINLASASQLSVALYDTLALPAPRNRSDR